MTGTTKTIVLVALLVTAIAAKAQAAVEMNFAAEGERVIVENPAPLSDYVSGQAHGPQM